MSGGKQSKPAVVTKKVCFLRWWALPSESPKFLIDLSKYSISRMTQFHSSGLPRRNAVFCKGKNTAPVTISSVMVTWPHWCAKSSISLQPTQTPSPQCLLSHGIFLWSDCVQDPSVRGLGYTTLHPSTTCCSSGQSRMQLGTPSKCSAQIQPSNSLRCVTAAQNSIWMLTNISSSSQAHVFMRKLKHLNILQTEKPICNAPVTRTFIFWRQNFLSLLN